MKKLYILLLCCFILGGCTSKTSETLKQTEPETSQTEEAKQTELDLSQTETTTSAAIPETINGFEKAEYEKYNSPAKENGLGDTRIYITGEVSFKVTTESFLGLILKDSNNYWIVYISDCPDEDGHIVDDMLNCDVRIFGIYAGFSGVFKMPHIEVNCENGLIEELKTGGKYETVFSFNDYGTEPLKESESVESTTSAPSESAIEEKEHNVSEVTPGMSNALKSAEDYISFMPFSHDGLVKQLKFEKYTEEEAQYGADNCGADWNEQAAKMAQSYLDMSAYSRDGLIKQLEFEGFSREQAVYGVEKCGL